DANIFEERTVLERFGRIARRFHKAQKAKRQQQQTQQGHGPDYDSTAEPLPMALGTEGIQRTLMGRTMTLGEAMKYFERDWKERKRRGKRTCERALPASVELVLVRERCLLYSHSWNDGAAEPKLTLAIGFPGGGRVARERIGTTLGNCRVTDVPRQLDPKTHEAERLPGSSRSCTWMGRALVPPFRCKGGKDERKRRPNPDGSTPFLFCDEIALSHFRRLG
ncbi:unnamed protein product, partial [Amoebophrya sp. A25]